MAVIFLSFQGRQFGWLRDFFGGAQEPTPVSQRRAQTVS